VLAARAQQPAMPVVGFLRSTSRAFSTPYVTAFSQGLKETGFVEGQNVVIESRYADDQPDRLPALVAELIRLPVALVVVNMIAAYAAKAATTTIPIVFAIGSDPVTDDFVASLNRPGGNLRGISFLNPQIAAKRLDLLRQFVPAATTIGILVMVKPTTPATEAERREVEAAAQTIGQPLAICDVGSDRDIETAFATLLQHRASALLVGSGAFLNSNRRRIVALADRYRLPAMFSQREATLAGGLTNYGPSITDAYRQAGIYAGRILKGEKPADLPVMQPSKLEFVINLKTAKAFGLQIPDKLLALAHEVIE
jgi:putative ABC transport system substrate-binding protein